MGVAIVVVAYDRHVSLSRLLSDLENAQYGETNVDLIISIDKNSNKYVYDIADSYHWKYGKKTVLKHEKNVGLREHVLFCGDLSQNFDAIIVLEDDLCLSRAFYRYATEAIEYYKDDDNIAGISLYSYRLSEFSDMRPFTPLQDDSDVFFAQVPSSWGQVWTANQWKNFRNWYDRKNYLDYDFRGMVPDVVLGWKESSWKKYFHMYLAATSKYFVYPRVALSTNMGDIGTHSMASSPAHQAILMGRFNRKYNFKRFSDPESVKYDSFFESVNFRTEDLKHGIESMEDITIDYYGRKEKYLKTRYLLSTKAAPYSLVTSWDLGLVPYELNIINNNKGQGLYLYDTTRPSNGSIVPDKLRLIKYEIPSITRKRALLFYFKESFAALKRRLGRSTVSEK